MADSQVEEVKSKIDIVSIVGEHVRLTKSGSNFRGLCPFHSEKSPSFMVSEELQIYKCFGCFPAGQFVKTPFGYHKIEDVVEGEYVISGKGNIKKVLVTMRRKYEGNLLTVKTSQLTEPVVMTEDHVVYTIGGAPLFKNHYKYLSKRLNFYKKYSQEERQSKTLKYFPIQKEKAGNLTKGMSLLYPVDQKIRDLETIDLSQYITKKWPAHGTKPLIPPLEVKVNKDFLKLIGYYIAEGSNHRAYIHFSLSSDEENFAKEIIELVKKIFSINGSIFRRIGRSGLDLTICNSILANVFENLCGKGTETKLDEKHKTIRHSVKTVSRTLSEQLTDILLRLSFFPSRGKEKERIDMKGVHHKEAFTLSWSTDPKVSKFRHFYLSEDGVTYWILPILEVNKKKFSGDVFNLNIEDDHSFVSNNFAVANCGEGGDVFTFLEKYEGMEFPEALKYLADIAGVKLVSSRSDNSSEKE